MERVHVGRMIARLLAVVFLLCVSAKAEDGFRELPVAQVSDRNLTALGQAALSIRPGEWKHAETANFIYHFFHGFMAEPVSVEAEFYYRVIAQDMEKDTAQWERKCHIFVFETDADWATFQQRASLDPWTGGIHQAGSLFIQRNPELRFKGSTLGHEITHLVVERFFGVGVPLWLNEGFAEYSATRCYAAFNRARGYAARPHSRAVPAGLYLPASQLTSLLTYPADVAQVTIFYNEAERLVRFLSAADKGGFGVFFAALAQGNRLETALSKGFRGRFINLDGLDREFKSFATQDGAPLPN